jgi:hypothetical protein
MPGYARAGKHRRDIWPDGELTVNGVVAYLQNEVAFAAMLRSVRYRSGTASPCLADAYVIDSPADAKNLLYLIAQPTSADALTLSCFIGRPMVQRCGRSEV